MSTNDDEARAERVRLESRPVEIEPVSDPLLYSDQEVKDGFPTLSDNPAIDFSKSIRIRAGEPEDDAWSDIPSKLSALEIAANIIVLLQPVLAVAPLIGSQLSAGARVIRNVVELVQNHKGLKPDTQSLMLLCSVLLLDLSDAIRRSSSRPEAAWKQRLLRGQIMVEETVLLCRDVLDDVRRWHRKKNTVAWVPSGQWKEEIDNHRQRLFIISSGTTLVETRRLRMHLIIDYRENVTLRKERADEAEAIVFDPALYSQAIEARVEEMKWQFGYGIGLLQAQISQLTRKVRAARADIRALRSAVQPRESDLTPEGAAEVKLCMVRLANDTLVYNADEVVMSIDCDLRFAEAQLKVLHAVQMQVGSTHSRRVEDEVAVNANLARLILLTAYSPPVTVSQNPARSAAMRRRRADRAARIDPLRRRRSPHSIHSPNDSIFGLGFGLIESESSASWG